jgi:hypothetical protein
MLLKYFEDLAVLSSALRSGHAFVPTLVNTANRMMTAFWPVEIKPNWWWCFASLSRHLVESKSSRTKRISIPPSYIERSHRTETRH